MTSIGVIGCGVVGGAVAKGFRRRGIKVRTFDKYKPEHDDIPQIFETDAIFVCVPTPTTDRGQDITALEDTFAMLKANKYGGAIVVKSTVLPGTTEALAQKFGLPKTCHNPEFLTAAKPFEDFMEQPAILIGGPHEAALTAGDIYFEAGFPSIRVFKTARVTEMAKYMHNLFLSVKVTFCNEFKAECDAVGVDYDQVRFAAIAMGGIGEGHTQAPGPDGKPGYGGMCFPKDTKAYLTYSSKHLRDFSLLRTTVQKNKEYRPEI